MKIDSSGLLAGGKFPLGGRPPSAPLGTVGGGVHPLSVLLFGKRPPRLLDKRRFPHLRKALRKLGAVKEQIAEILGVPEGALSIELAEGANASISRDGVIAFGRELLERRSEDDDLMVAILAHEIGHQPWTWPKSIPANMRKKDRDQLYRDEEAKADRFAGRVLAELDADPEVVCRFLQASETFEGVAPSDYYPAKVRAQMVRDAYRRRKRTLKRRRVAGLFEERQRELR